jgi:hypothetical protein
MSSTTSGSPAAAPVSLGTWASDLEEGSPGLLTGGRQGLAALARPMDGFEPLLGPGVGEAERLGAGLGDRAVERAAFDGGRAAPGVVRPDPAEVDLGINAGLVVTDDEPDRRGVSLGGDLRAGNRLRVSDGSPGGLGEWLLGPDDLALGGVAGAPPFAELGDEE